MEKRNESAWLSQLMGKPAVIYLSNGIKLEGVLRDFDLDVLMLTPAQVNDGPEWQMIYKDSVSTIQPARPKSRPAVSRALSGSPQQSGA